MQVPWTALLAVALVGGWAHPMHTTVTEVVEEDARGRVSIQVRVYLDDLRAAVPRRQARCAPIPRGPGAAIPGG